MAGSTEDPLPGPVAHDGPRRMVIHGDSIGYFFGDGGRTLQGVGEVGDPQPAWCSDQWISHVVPASDFEENAIPPVFPPMLGGNEMENPWFPRRNSEIIFSQETIQE